MSKIPYQKFFPFSLAISLAWQSSPPIYAGPVLKGNVNEQGYAQSNQDGPSLNRDDLGRQGDPFGNSEEALNQTFDPGATAFQGYIKKPLPPPGFNLETSEQNFKGEPMQGTADANPEKTASRDPLQAGAAEANDESEEMRLAWDAWHKRLAETIYKRFMPLSDAAFKFSAPLTASVGFTVTRDGRIINVHFNEKSSNVMFNSLILGVISSLSGNMSVLEFPGGSRRQSVDKSGFFSNVGSHGYKYWKGDQETIPGR